MYFASYRVGFDSFARVLLFYLAYFAVAQILISEVSAYINLILGLLMAVSFYGAFKRLDLMRQLQVIQFSMLFAASLLIVDSGYRLLNPGLPLNANASEEVLLDRGDWFYLYKFGTIMFQDSNTTALIALCYYYVVVSARAHAIGRLRSSFFVLQIVFASLIVFSFSRAAIAALVVSELLRVKFNKYLKFFVFLLSSLLFVYYYDFSWLFQDLSLGTKFDIIAKAQSAFSELSFFESLFGVGFGVSLDRFGFFAHNIYVEYLIGSGVLGLLVFLFVFFRIFAMTSMCNRYLIFSIAIVSMSYFLYAGTPFLFVSIAAIHLLNRPG